MYNPNRTQVFIICFTTSIILFLDSDTYVSSLTNIWRIEELVERLVRWGIHPEELITHRFELEQVSEAYRLMAGGKCGKVAVVFDEELK